MEELRSMDEIKNEISNINFAQNVEANPKPTIVQEEKNETKKIIDEVHTKAVIETIKNSKEVQEEIVEKAKASIKNEMDVLDKEETKRVQDATYDANKEACECFGIEQGVQVWKIRAMRFLHDFWFIVYLAFAFITICPVNVFCKGIKRFIKSNWLVVLSGIFMYLLITIFIPFLIIFLKKE